MIEMDMILWCVMMVFFILVECVTIALVSVWFVFGALAAFIAAAMSASFQEQCYLFVAVSAILFLATRPLVRGLKIQKVPTNADGVVGMEGVVQTKIDNLLGEGRVLVNGLDWAAKSTRGRNIESGKKVIVDKLEGVTLYVTEIVD
ncbi:MAG: NfeD family protein [Planctomycetia bacterium]|nr:NfeD family protein [Planctomycetia bacterium]